MGQRGGTLYFHLESKNSYLVEPPKDIFSSHDGPIKMAKIAKKKEEKEVELGRHPYLINSNSIAQKIKNWNDKLSLCESYVVLKLNGFRKFWV